MSLCKHPPSYSMPSRPAACGVWWLPHFNVQHLYDQRCSRHPAILMIEGASAAGSFNTGVSSFAECFGAWALVRF